MNKWQAMVEEFHREFGCTVGSHADPEIRDSELRVELIDEEVREFKEAIEANDLIAAIDALCDIAYVTIGAATTFGVDLDPFFREVHGSNMTKVGGFRRADGKILKGDDYQPPDLERVLWLAKRAARLRRNGE